MAARISGVPSASPRRQVPYRPGAAAPDSRRRIACNSFETAHRINRILAPSGAAPGNIAYRSIDGVRRYVIAACSGKSSACGDELARSIKLGDCPPAFDDLIRVGCSAASTTRMFPGALISFDFKTCSTRTFSAGCGGELPPPAPPPPRPAPSPRATSCSIFGAARGRAGRRSRPPGSRRAFSRSMIATSCSASSGLPPA